MKKKCRHCGTSNEAGGANPITEANGGWVCNACREYRAFLAWYRERDEKRKAVKRGANRKQDSLQQDRKSVV